MKKLDTFVGPGKIKRREVSWTLMKKLDNFAGREVELGSKSWTSFALVVTQQQCNVFVTLPWTAFETATTWYTMARGQCLNILVVLAVVHCFGSGPFLFWRWTIFALVVTQQQCNVFVTLPWTAFERATTWYTMARGQCLNILVVLAVVHCLLGLPGRCTQSSLYYSCPLPPPPPTFPSLISNLASVDMKQNVYLLTTNTAIPFLSLLYFFVPCRKLGLPS